MDDMMLIGRGEQIYSASTAPLREHLAAAHSHSATKLAFMDERLETIIMETIEKWGQELVEMEVMPDHVHLLLGYDPQFGIHRLVKSIKGTSSRYLRQEFPQLKRKLPSLWTNSYFVCTVGGVTLETLKRYVEGQKNR